MKTKNTRSWTRVWGVVVGGTLLILAAVLLLGRMPHNELDSREQAVIVYISGDVSEEEAKQHDISGLEEQLIAVIEAGDLGEFDGNEFGPEGATLFMYTPDAEKLFRAIEPTLRAFPLSRHAKVLVRKGPPGSPQREIHL